MSYCLTKLGDLCDINPRLPKNTDESQKVSFLTMSSVSEKGEIVEQETRVLSDTKKGFTYFERNDILLAKITPCFENGKAVHTSNLENNIGYGSTEFHVLRPIIGKSIGKYVFYLVWNDSFRFHGQHSMKGAAGQKRVSADFLKNFKTHLPPLEEQQKIVDILDAADNLRQKDQQLIDHYTKLSRSLFMDMFGDPVANPMDWDEYQLNDCCTKISVGFVGTCEPFYTDSSGVPMIRTGNLSDSGLRLHTLKYVTREFHEKQKKSQLEAGDLLIARHGDNGKAVLYNGNFESANCLNIVILRGSDKLTSLYAQYFLNNKSTRTLIQSRTGGATQKVINTKEIHKLILPLAPITLQNKFAERIAIIEQQKQQAEASLKKSEALFNSLLQRAFNGELTGDKVA